MPDNYALSYHEILTKVNNKKDKKVEVLKRYDTNELRMFLKACFDPKCYYQKAHHHTKMMHLLVLNIPS